MKITPSIITTIHQIKADFEHRRSINTDNKSQLTNLKNNIVYVKKITAELSSRIMSINAGIAFRERKELTPIREDVDDLGLSFDRVDMQTKNLTERVETMKVYTNNLISSAEMLVTEFKA